MNEAEKEEIIQIANRAKEASALLARTSNEDRNKALRFMADALKRSMQQILEANAEDVACAKEANTKESLIDRLLLNEARINEMADALLELAELPDPLGKVLFEDTLENGIEIKRISVPMGVVGIIYEARPNVTADACGICLKSGNACLLKGGSLAIKSNIAIAEVLSSAACDAGMPDGAISLITSTDRDAADLMMSLAGIVDVLIPRGGSGLIQHCVMNSKVPVIETGTGNCHVYIHESADMDMARNIVQNAKCRRFGVCNAIETLLIDKNYLDEAIDNVVSVLLDEGILIHADTAVFDRLQNKAFENLQESQVVKATDEDWAKEYLAPEIAVKVVANIDEAIAHISKYGTRHSESIVAKDVSAIEKFLNEIDAACVYSNASTAFTDGGQFGLGAEIGISTQKMHVRGPFALEGLTSYKYVLKGNGQIRD